MVDTVPGDTQSSRGADTRSQRQPTGNATMATSEGFKRGQSRYTIGLANQVARAQKVVIETVRRVTGIDISDRTPSDLKVVDQLLGKQLRDVLRAGDQGYDRAAFALGSYLGEVIVHELGGQWHHPSFLQSLVLLISGNEAWTDKYWYVVVKGEEVHVFRAARQAIQETSRVFSLYGFYERVEETLVRVDRRNGHPERVQD